MTLNFVWHVDFYADFCETLLPRFLCDTDNVCKLIRDEKDQWIRSKYEHCDFLAPTPYAEVPLHRVSNHVVFVVAGGGGGGRTGTVGGRSPRCFLWVLPIRSISKPDQQKRCYRN